MKKMKNKKMIIVLLLFLIILLSIINMILARYRSKATSQGEVEIAYYVLGTEYQTQTLNLDSMVPRQEPYNYTIAVSNEKDGLLSETAIEYTIQMKATTNLPLKYTLLEENGETNQFETTETTQDENGVYYINLKTSLKELGIQQEVHKYILSIEFPIEYKANSEYADIIELVEITVDSKQKI